MFFNFSKGGRLKCPCSVGCNEALMFDELWQEIADSPAEIFDLPEMREFSEEYNSEEDESFYDDLATGIDFDSNFDF